MNTTIFDRMNRPIGKLTETASQIRAFDMKGKLKGYYDKNSDRTMNENNALFSKGNRVVALLG